MDANTLPTAEEIEKARQDYELKEAETAPEYVMPNPSDEKLGHVSPMALNYTP